MKHKGFMSHYFMFLLLLVFIMSFSLQVSAAGVSAPSRLKISRVNGTELLLKWKAGKGDGYLIYRYDQTTKQYKKIKKLAGAKKTQFSDTNTNANLVQAYAIRAYKKGGKVTSKAVIRRWNGYDRAAAYIAHRGAMNIAPENTLAAFRKAKEQGYRAFECDVWYTKSKDLMVAHNDNLSAICNVNINIANINKTNRMKYPVKTEHYENYPPQYLCTLEEVLSFCARENMTVYLHYWTRQSQHPANAIKKTAQLIKKYKMQKKAIVFSTNSRDLRALSKYKLRTGYLTRATALPVMKKAAHIAHNNKCELIIMPYKPDVSMPPALIKHCHKLGLKTYNYSVKTPEQVQLLINNGSDGWISNHPVFVR